jgi:hypothetical protein
MIPRNAEPIGHISPYARIDPSPVKTTRAKQQGPSAVDEIKRIAEAERIWRLVVLAAEGNWSVEAGLQIQAGAVIACANKREMRERLRAIARAVGARNPQRLGDQLALLIDGAYGHAVTLGPDGLKRELIDTATVLIDAQIR